MRGIVGWGVHVPHRRLDRAEIPALVGTGGGKGARAVASYDEDTTTMAVEASRRALAATRTRPRALWFATAAPAYLDKTNATAVHAALRLDRETTAYDALGSVRSAVGALTAALDSAVTSLVVASDVRVGLPGGPEETAGGDAAAALLVGDGDADAPVLAEVIAGVGLTEEFLDRWRAPGEATSRTWEERFGETKYVPLGQEALKAALGEASLDVADIDLLAVAGLHERACATVAKRSGVDGGKVVDRLATSVGNPGVAQPFLMLAGALEQARPGDVVALVTLADGADVLLLRATDAMATYRPAATVVELAGGGARVAYGRYLAWRGILPLEPPRRPEPARPSASAAGRSTDWKFGLAEDGAALADQAGTVTTFTIDKLAYSPSPPVVFAVVDFDDGQRLPVELTDVDADEVEIGMRVQMTFRRLFTADGIANYFWKARPMRTEPIDG